MLAGRTYYDYIFPDEAAAQPNLKLLALAKMWKKDVVSKQTVDNSDAGSSGVTEMTTVTKRWTLTSTETMTLTTTAGLVTVTRKRRADEMLRGGGFHFIIPFC